jgi:hypothetical protein
VETDDQHDRPRTIDEAVRLLLALVPDPEQAKIAAMPENDLIRLHFGLGMWIRNNLGLWQANSPLLEATGETDPDDASGVIIRAFWQRLRDDLPKVH